MSFPAQKINKHQTALFTTSVLPTKFVMPQAVDHSSALQKVQAHIGNRKPSMTSTPANMMIGVGVSSLSGQRNVTNSAVRMHIGGNFGNSTPRFNCPVDNGESAVRGLNQFNSSSFTSI